MLEKILDLQELSDSAPKTPHVSNPADASGSAKPAAASEPAPNERLEPLLVVLDLQGTLVFFDSTINADRPRPYLAPFLSFLASNDALCRQRLDIAICAVFYQPCGSKVLTYIGLLSNDSETILRDKKWTAKPGEPLARIVSLDEMNAREGDDVELGRCIKLVLEGTGWTPERTVFVSSQEFVRDCGTSLGAYAHQLFAAGYPAPEPSSYLQVPQQHPRRQHRAARARLRPFAPRRRARRSGVPG